MRHRFQHAATSALAASCLLAATAAQAAGAQPRPAPADWPTKPNTATTGAFSVVQVATADADKFMAEWRKPTPGVKLHATHQIGRGRPITTFIAYRGCRTDKAGKCHVTATFSLLSPTGKVDAYPPMQVSNPQLQPKPGIIYMSSQGLGMTFTASDPLGVHTLKAAITDQVAGVTLHTQQALTVYN